MFCENLTFPCCAHCYVSQGLAFDQANIVPKGLEITISIINYLDAIRGC